MNPIAIIQKYYDPQSPAYAILVQHSRAVAQKAVEQGKKHPELHLDLKFVEEAAMLHDIGMFLTDADDIDCHGTYPYICHGYLGADLIRKEGYPQHALVCERHTGTGLSLEHIIKNKLPVPQRDMLPISLEEQLICFADKFYSKNRLDKVKSVEKIRKSLSKYGDNAVERFNKWCKLFG